MNSRELVYRLYLGFSRMAVYYAVARGRVAGVYSDWDACKAQVLNVTNAKFKKFKTLEEAEEFVKSFRAPANQKPQTVLPVKPSLPLPLSPTKNKHNPKCQLNRPSQESKVSSPPKNLTFPLPLTKSDWSTTKLNFGSSQKQTVQQAQHEPPSPKQGQLAQNETDDVVFVSSTHEQVQPAQNTSDGISPSTYGQAQSTRNTAYGMDLSQPAQVNESEIPKIAESIQSPAVGTSPIPLISSSGDLKERFDVFEKTYLEFHKQMISEIRSTKRRLTDFTKVVPSNNLLKNLQASVAEGMSSLETSFKTVMVQFSSELSSLQKLTTDGNIAATMSSNSVRLAKAKKSSASAKKNRVTNSKNMTRRKLVQMLQPMTPSQVILANKRSYSTDAKDFSEPPEKVTKTEHEQGATIKIEPTDEADGGIHRFHTDAEGYVHVYTDGACEQNGRSGAKAGIGVWFGQNHPLNCSEPVKGRPTNNVAEIQAAQWAIDLARGAGVRRLCINTDSEFLIKSITMWIHKWKKNKWMLSTGGPVKNKENFQALDVALQGMDVKWNHVRGHRGILGNEMADALARAGARRFKNS